jgi:type IV secretory pathway VirD2 relaxase
MAGSGLGMTRDDEDRFRPQPGKPGRSGERFITQVLQQAGKAGARSMAKPPARAVAKPGHQPGARLGRGHVAARFAGQGLGANARRVAIKIRLVNLAKAGTRSSITHLRYIEREGVNRLGGPGQAYGPSTDTADLDAFRERGQDDRHQFRFIISPEDAEQLDDLRTYTRHLMQRMETDLGTRLDWVAVDHWNTDNPHTHVVLRGKNELGKDLIIARDYIAHGMRQRAAALATEWLGPRTELEIRQALGREVTQERWTSLDRTLQREATEGQLTPAAFARPHLQAQRQLLVGRLQHLQRMGLAAEATPGTWALQPDAEPTLRALGERGDIIRTLQRAMGGQRRELAIHTTGQAAPVPPVILGRVAAKGLADELNDNGYLVIDSTDGKAHYLPLPARTELEQFPLGGIVEARSNQGSHAADRNIAALAVDGIYRTDHHLAVVRGQGKTGSHAQGTVTAHVRRLEALRCAGIVERVAEGVWRIPTDLPARGQQYDTQRSNCSCHVSVCTGRGKTGFPARYLRPDWRSTCTSPSYRSITENGNRDHTNLWIDRSLRPIRGVCRTS